MLHDSCCPVMKPVESFKCLVYNGVLGTGLSFSPNSAFSATRHDLSLQAPRPSHPYCGNCTLPWRTHTHRQTLIRTRAHTQRLPTAAGVSERQKWPIFSPFHLNNKQGVMLKWAREERREIGLIRVILNQQERGLAAGK